MQVLCWQAEAVVRYCVGRQPYTCSCAIFTESDWRLLLVTRASIVGRLPPNGDAVYCVDRITLLPLSLTLLPEEIKAQESQLQEVIVFMCVAMLCCLYTGKRASGETTI